MFKPWLSLIVALFVVVACNVSTSSAKEDEKIEMAGGKVVASKPTEWKAVKPKINMIEHEFVAPAEGEQQARVTVMQATGSVDANIERWIGQFDGAKKEDAKIEDKEVNGLKVHVVDITGTFMQKMGGPFAPGPTEKLENHRMIGVIIESKNEGKIFIKMTGPNDVVAKLKEGVDKLVSTVEEK